MPKRLNLSLPERSAERLERLRERTDAGSATEVIKHALMTYESLVDHLSQGTVFTAHQRNGESFAVEFMIDCPKPNLRLVDA